MESSPGSRPRTSLATARARSGASAGACNTMVTTGSPSDAVAEARPRRRGPAPAGALSRALSRVQRPPFPPARPAPARRALLLCLRQKSAAGRRPGRPAAAPRPASAAPRAPRRCCGELLHLDGSRHRWLALCPDRWFTLIAVVDDATKQLLYAALH